MGKWCLQASSFIFDRIIIRVAGNQDRHKSSDEFCFGPLVSMAHLYVFWNEIWPWHVGLRWAIVALWATCLKPRLKATLTVGSIAIELNSSRGTFSSICRFRICNIQGSRVRATARSRSFRGKWSWNNFYFLPSVDSKKGSCRLLAKIYVCSLSSGNRQGISLSRKSVSRLIDNCLYVPWVPG